MDDSIVNLYVDYINKRVLPGINYTQLQADYQTEEKLYAKSVLNALHKAAVEIYGTEYFERNTMEGGFVLLPGVVQSKENGNLCIALLELDLQSSGEHWGTDYLTQYGCINQSEEELPVYIRHFLRDTYGPYDYGYTATVACDIHVNEETLPEEMKAVLADYQNHEFVPCRDPEDVLKQILAQNENEEMER